MVSLEGVRGVVCDVDGVVHSGSRVHTAAVDSLNRWQREGVRLVFLTNNASRSPQDLAVRLREDGVELQDDQVLTGALAGAHVLAQRVARGTRVLVAGSTALARAVESEGLRVTEDPALAQAVVQGFAPELTLARLHDATRVVASGAPWVATNADLSLPTEWGEAPGNGAWVRAVSEATGRVPVVAGKPEPGAYGLVLERLGLESGEVVGIGDRLETDVAGARRSGLHSVLVTTGIHGRSEVAAARTRGDEHLVPDHVVDSLAEVELVAGPRGGREG